MTKQSLKHIRDLELSSCCSPLTGMLLIILENIFCRIYILFPIKINAFINISILSNIHGIIYQTHAIIRGFMLKCIPILLTKLNHKGYNFRSSIRNLNRIGLNMGNSKALLLNGKLKVDHEEGSSFSDNIVNVSRISAGIIKRSRSKTIYAVYCNLQSIGQIICILIRL